MSDANTSTGSSEPDEVHCAAQDSDELPQGGSGGSAAAGASRLPQGARAAGGASAEPDGSGWPPAQCQADGCEAPLQALSYYNQRYRVCMLHQKAPATRVGGLEQRFCQQCGRFHQLDMFDGVKRSCRDRLSRHNARRRKGPTAGGTKAVPGKAARLQPAAAGLAVPASAAAAAGAPHAFQQAGGGSELAAAAMWDAAGGAAVRPVPAVAQGQQEWGSAGGPSFGLAGPGSMLPLSLQRQGVSQGLASGSSAGFAPALPLGVAGGHAGAPHGPRPWSSSQYAQAMSSAHLQGEGTPSMALEWLQHSALQQSLSNPPLTAAQQPVLCQPLPLPPLLLQSQSLPLPPFAELGLVAPPATWAQQQPAAPLMGLNHNKSDAELFHELFGHLAGAHPGAPGPGM